MTVKDLQEVLNQADPTQEVKAVIIVTADNGSKMGSMRNVVDVRESRDVVIIETD